MTTPSLHVTDLACRRGGRRVFDGLSFSLNGGELLALTGANGSGKTTLLRALASLGRAEAGTIYWNDADIAWLGHLDGLKAISRCSRTSTSPNGCAVSRPTRHASRPHSHRSISPHWQRVRCARSQPASVDAPRLRASRLHG